MDATIKYSLAESESTRTHSHRRARGNCGNTELHERSCIYIVTALAVTIFLTRDVTKPNLLLCENYLSVWNKPHEPVTGSGLALYSPSVQSQ